MYLILLPLLCFVLIFYFLCCRGPGTDPRRAFLSAAVIWGVIATAIIEVLNIQNMVTVATLASCWGAAAVGAALVVGRRVSLPQGVPRWTFRSPSLAGVIMAGPIVVILLVTAVIAVFGWPNQTDTMVYHLSRVDHWTQNKSVAFYPTHIVRQLFNPPWSEYAILHLTLLGGDERFANLPQWFSMLGSLIGVSVIAKHLGATPLGQLFAVLFCATIPMGVLQASGTQNDYVTAFWLVCMVDALLAPQQAPHLRALSIGAALGLALLTKGTSYMFAAPLLIILAQQTVFYGRTIVEAGVVIVVALALSAPHYFRNLDTFGSVLGPRNLGSATEVDDNLANETFSPPILLSNLIRNVALHAGTPLPAFNALIEGVVQKWHTWLGISLTDSRSTRLYPEDRFRIVNTPRNPDRTGNPLHLFVIAIATALIVISKQLPHKKIVCTYLSCLVIGFVLFSSALKWQPWHSRLHLPLFVLWSPVVGALYGLHPKMSLMVGLLMSVQAWPPLVDNILHPLTGERSVFRTARIDQYFPFRSTLKAEYIGAAEFLRSRNCTEVGLLLGWDELEHPLWPLLSELRTAGGRFEHIGVNNSSAHLESRWPTFTPCAVLAISNSTGEKFSVGGRSYRLAWLQNPVKIFMVDEPPPPGVEFGGFSVTLGLRH